jgi:hypothetical protein
MQQLFRRSLFSFASIQTVLKGYGIINPHIFRNLRSFPSYSASQNSMKVDSASTQPILKPAIIPSPALEPSLPTQASRQGTSHSIQTHARRQVNRE